MSQLEILTAHCPVDFDFDVSCSPTLSSSLPRSHNEKYFANTLVHGLFSPTLHSHSQDNVHVLKNPERHYDDEVSIPGLPPLHRGHADVHLRNGVMNALHLGAAGEVDAERAFFVADLSSVYKQHQRWKKLLPEIEPFYGESVRLPRFLPSCN